MVLGDADHVVDLVMKVQFSLVVKLLATFGKRTGDEALIRGLVIPFPMVVQQRIIYELFTTSRTNRRFWCVNCFYMVV